VHENGTTQNALKQLTTKGLGQIRQQPLHHPALQLWVNHLGQLNELLCTVYTIRLEALFVKLN
jgi:hypothetical protein